MEAGEPPIRRNTSYRTSLLLITGPIYSALHGSRERCQASDQAKGSALRVRRDCRPNLGLRGTGTGPDKRFSPCRDFERLGRLHHLRLDGLLFHPRPSGVFLCSAVGAEVHLEVKLFASSVARKDSPTCGAGRRIASHLPYLLLARSLPLLIPPFSVWIGTHRYQSPLPVAPRRSQPWRLTRQLNDRPRGSLRQDTVRAAGHPGICASSGSFSQFGFHSGTRHPSGSTSPCTSPEKARRTSSLSRTLSPSSR